MIRTTLAALLLAAVLGGCSASLKSTHNGFTYEGLGGRAYACAGADVFARLDDEDYLSAGIFGGAARRHEIASIDVWPIFGVGVGIAGARIQILPIEIGLGVLFYRPSPPDRTSPYADDPEYDPDEIYEEDEHEDHDHDRDHDDADDDKNDEDFR